MRFFSALLLVVGLSFAAGCGDDSSPSEMDLSVTAGDSCLMIVTCGQGCAGNASCEAACATKGSAAAMTKYQALFGCAYGQCTTAHDGGAAACTSNTDSSAGCLTCVMSAAQAPACMTQLNACLGG